MGFILLLLTMLWEITLEIQGSVPSSNYHNTTSYMDEIIHCRPTQLHLLEPSSSLEPCTRQTFKLRLHWIASTNFHLVHRQSQQPPQTQQQHLEWHHTTLYGAHRSHNQAWSQTITPAKIYQMEATANPTSHHHAYTTAWNQLHFQIRSIRHQRTSTASST